MSDMKKRIEQLVDKAAETANSTDAMKFAQAAVNATQAMLGLADIARADKREASGN